MNVFTDVRNLAAQKISAQNHAANPQQSSGHIVGKVAPVRHFGRAGNRRAKRPNDGNESRYDDGLPAILFVELAGALQVALAEYQRIFPAIKCLARFPANPVADLVSADRAQGNEKQELRKMHLPGGGQHTGRDQQGIAGQKKSDEEARLDEDDDAHEQRAAPLNKALYVKQKMK